MQSVKYLERVRDTLPGKTNTALAEHLGISQGAVSHYLSGRRVMDEETCLAVAISLEINPMEVMMAAGIDRAEKTGQKSLWSVFSQRMATTAASLVVAAGVTGFLTPGNAEARTYSPTLLPNTNSIYIM